MMRLPQFREQMIFKYIRLAQRKGLVSSLPPTDRMNGNRCELEQTRSKSEVKKHFLMKVE